MANNSKFTFLRQVPKAFVPEREDKQTGEKYLQVNVPGDSASSTGKVQFRVSPDNVFPATDNNGKEIPGHFNVRLDATQPVEVSYIGEDGNPARGTRTPQQLVGAWQKNQREYAEKQGQKVWLNGVNPAMIHEAKFDPKNGVKMMNVSVADPESVPKAGKETGYASFLVPESSISDTKDGKKRNIYLGRENETIGTYQIHTGIDANGNDSYAKVSRTVGEVKANYEADIEAYKAKMAAKGNDGKGDDGKGNDGKEDDAPDFT